MRNEKVTQFIIKLIKMTRSGELIWQAFPPQNNELLNGEIILDKIYQAIVSEKTFHLYRYKYKVFTDEYDFEWFQRIRIELIDKNGRTDYAFEYDNSMSDLYDIVREQTSNVTDIIDDILGVKIEIVEATYYTTKQSKDVTNEIRKLVIDNKLVVNANNDIAGDPEYGVVKKLNIKYRYAGEVLQKEVNEGQTITLP